MVGGELASKQSQSGLWFRNAQRNTTLLVAALVPLAFTRQTLDMFTLPKATILVVAGLAIAASWASESMAARAVTYPDGWGVRAAAVFGVALLVAVGTSGTLLLSLNGSYSRYTGGATYLAGLVLLLAIATGFAFRELRWLASVLVAVSVAVAAYALMQRAGLDPIDWGEGANVVSTLGNPNFVAAFVAIVLPIGVGLLWDRRSEPRAKVLVGALVALAGLAVAASVSYQGIVAGAAGLFVLAVGLALGARPAMRGRAFGALGGIALLGVGATVAGLAGAGPVAAVLGQRSVELRLDYWRAAWAMFLDRPLLGVGIGRYADHYREYRTAQAAATVDLSQGSDAAHNVPLEFFATGGLLVGLTYLGFVVVVAVVLVRGLRSVAPGQRALLAGFGGAWAAYQVISLLGVDIAPIMLLHWLTAAAILVLAGDVRLKRWPARRPAAHGRSRQPVGAAASGTLAVVVLLGLVASWLASAHLRADLRARDAHVALFSGAPDVATGLMAEASETAPWQPHYLLLQAQFESQAGSADLGSSTYGRVTAVNPRRFDGHLGEARALAALGEGERALEEYLASRRLEPHHPDLTVEVAEHLNALGRPEEARLLLDEALSITPDHAGAAELRGSLTD